MGKVVAFDCVQGTRLIVWRLVIEVWKTEALSCIQTEEPANEDQLMHPPE